EPCTLSLHDALPILEMIRAGYLVDLRGLRVRLAVDFSRLRVSHGDFVDADAAAALTAADAPAHACAAYLEHAPGRKALLFTPTVDRKSTRLNSSHDQ